MNIIHKYWQGTNQSISTIHFWKRKKFKPGALITPNSHTLGKKKCGSLVYKCKGEHNRHKKHK
jgi:hypothetical protein